jgi:tetratricopeptide (TPR) repeat protein
LTRFGDYESAAVQQSAALESARASWGEDNSLTLRLASELATAYSLLGRHADATSLQEDVLERTHSSRGKEPYALLAARVLGDVYRRAGRHEEARSLLREALGGQIEIVGERSSDVADTRYSLGCLAAATGQRREALDQLSQAVDLRWAERTILDEADLDDLRGEPEFEALVAEVKRRLKIKD